MENIGKYITQYIKGKVPKTLYEEQVNGSLPYLSPDYLRGKSDPEFYAIPSDKTVLVENGDVIVLWDGSNAGEIFESKKGILGSTMVKLEFDSDKLHTGYYSYSFQYLEYFLKAKTAGSGIPHADKGVIKRLNFFKPPKPEQTAIATILSKIDEAIEAATQSIKAAEKLKKALMQNLLSGKLKPDGTWRTEDEFYEDEKCGKIPKGWIIAKGNKITDKITKGQSPKWQGFEYQDSGILFVTSENVQNGFIDIKEPKYLPLEFHTKIKNSQLKKGDILINIVGASIGRCSIFDLDVGFANTNQAVCVFRLNDSNNSEFICYYLQNERTQRRLLGTQVETARANLSLGDFRKFKFVIPENIEEQKEIGKRISKIQEVVIGKQSKIKTLERLKKSLMQQLLTGKKRLSKETITHINQTF
ncbi:restriction endonuclease subunit S [Elizabethkingia anophelis]|uniref:restriction endonuclease subunit S n=1 Tax=Elizabethkingia anophelis TaxID=1117645 RepID=UPI00293C4F93|nr:hypothetical protein [Elizabethkingia anophelis]